MRRTAPAPRARHVLGALALLLAAGAPLGAQDLRTVELSRQVTDSQPLSVRVEYVAGKVVVHGAEQPLLYHAQLAYDPRRGEPSYRYDPAARELRLGLRRIEAERSGPTGAPELELDLARTVPVALRFQMGAATADLDLGGMRLTRLNVEAGASETELHFDTPNLAPMELLALDLGTGSVTARGLANARARELRLAMKLGSARLEFGGDWRENMELALDVLVGNTTIRVPDDVGVRVSLGRGLASFDGDGFEKRDDGWYSANWDRAARRLTVRGRTLLGAVTVERGAN